MGQTSISIRNVSKKYRLFNSKRERLMEALHPFNKKYHKEFWALRDISFDIEKGCTIGILGRNGSGKSTLLQVICSVLSPTFGSVEVDGRIAALLELGAGFNPELTGRANVILKSTIMGLSRKEVEQRFPLIEAFADIGEFIDQPVKTYSSGMFVRLAFATSINIDPDILIVDEALSVGDAKFQNKCFNKFHEFQRSGKTILFVSHSTDTIVKHCDYALLMDSGRLIESGEPKRIVNCYIDLLFSGSSQARSMEPQLLEEGYRGFDIIRFKEKCYAVSKTLGELDLASVSEEELGGYTAALKCVVAPTVVELKDELEKLFNRSGPGTAEDGGVGGGGRPRDALAEFISTVQHEDNCCKRMTYNENEYRHGDRRAEIIDYLIVVEGKPECTLIETGDTVDVYMKVKFNTTVMHPMYGFALVTVDGVMVYGNNTRLSRIETAPEESGAVVVMCWSLKLSLNKGDYFMTLGVAEQVDIDTPIDNRKDLIHLHIESDDFFDGIVSLKTGFQKVEMKMQR